MTTDQFPDVPCPGLGTVPPDDLPLREIKPLFAPGLGKMLKDYVGRQLEGKRPGELNAWGLKREYEYYSNRGWEDHICSYATELDLACWQLNRNEAEVFDFLKGFREAAKGVQCQLL